MSHRNVNVMVVCALVVVGVVLIPPAIQQSRERSRRSISKNNLAQIGRAILTYNEVFNYFPAGGTFDTSLRGYHGWGLFILPYLDSSSIYNYINFEQPWDSESNARRLRFRHPMFQIPGETRMGSCNSDYAHYSANANVMGANAGIESLFIRRVTGELFLAGELGGDFVPWASPYNWRRVSGVNLKPLTYGRYSGFGAYFVFLDGHVEFVGSDVSLERLNSMSGENLSERHEEHGGVIRPSTFRCPSHE